MQKYLKKGLAMLLMVLMLFTTLPVVAMGEPFPLDAGAEGEGGLEITAGNDAEQKQSVAENAGQSGTRETLSIGITPLSLLPLDEVELTAYIVLTSEEKKSAVNLYDFLDSLEGGGVFNHPSVILWNTGTMDNPSYREVDSGDTVDLSAMSNGDKLMFIGGNTANQFDRNNKRYIVTVNFETIPVFADVALFAYDISEGSFLTSSRVFFNGQTAKLSLPPDSDLGADYLLSLNGVPTATEHYTAKVYKGALSGEGDIPINGEDDVTARIIDGEGLSISFTAGVAQAFTIVYWDAQDSILGFKTFSIQAEIRDIEYPSYAYLYMYAEENGSKGSNRIDYNRIPLYGGTNVSSYIVPANMSLDSNFYFTMPLSSMGYGDAYYTLTVYKGEYTSDTLESALATDDITADIMGSEGWKTSFGSGNTSQKLSFVIQSKIDNSILSITVVTVAVAVQTVTIYLPGSVWCNISPEENYSPYGNVSFGSYSTISVQPRKPLTEDYYLWFDSITSDDYTVKVYEGAYTDDSALEGATDITDAVFLKNTYKVNFGGENIGKHFTFLFDKVDGIKEIKNIEIRAAFSTVYTPSSSSFRLYKEDISITSSSVYFSTSVPSSTTSFSIPQNYALNDTFNLRVDASLASETNLYTTTVYKGNFVDESAIPTAPEEDVTADFLGDGYSLSFADGATHSFTFVFHRKMDGLFIGAKTVTLGATEMSISYPYSTRATLSVIEGGVPATVSASELYIGSGTGKFYFSQKYPLNEKYIIKLPAFTTETSIYKAEIYTGRFTAEADIPTETEAKVTDALLGDGYELSFGDGATTDFTFVFTRKLDGQFLAAKPVSVGAGHREVVFPSDVNFMLYAKDKNSASQGKYKLIDTRGGTLSTSFSPTIIFPVQPKLYSLRNDTFGISAAPFNDDDIVTEVYEGIFADIELLTEDAKITDAFYGRYGYEMNFDNEAGEREFTFLCTNKYNTTEVRLFCVILSAAYFTDNLSDYKIVDFSGAKDVDTYKVRDIDDSYAQYGYQTLLVAGGANLSNLTPIYKTDEKVSVYAFGQKQTSGTNTQSFQNGPVLYTAIAEDTKTAANYQVAYVSQEYGARLFVNGPKTREIYFDNAYGYTHDILIANIGSQELHDISVSLVNAVNVKLDGYWNTEGYTYYNRLAAFTTVDSSATEYGQLPNIAKIRLLPDEHSDGGAISGTLQFRARDANDNLQEINIKLTGFAGKPELTTHALTPAVKYVPYSFLFSTNNIHNDKTKPMYNQVSFSPVGSLPSGLELFPGGELYGVPKETGVFPIKVKITYSLAGFEDEEAEFSLTVLTNDDANVNAQNDYPDNMVRVENMTTLTYREQVLGINHDFENWTGLFFLNGRELAEGIDYDAEDGSTRITIYAQTFRNEGAGTHTIAAEFRDQAGAGDIMTKGAQNYTVTTPGETDYTDSTGGKSSSPSGSSSGSPSATVAIAETPSPTTSIAVTPTRRASTLFNDVSANEWCEDVILWAYDNGYMVGVGDGQFDPSGPITNAMVATVLFRLAKVDPRLYESMVFDDVNPGQWYSITAAWAKHISLFGNDQFNPYAFVPRGQMALILYRFLSWFDDKLVVTADGSVVFPDESNMTPEEVEAFRVLYKMGIFVGKGNNYMDATGTTIRSELAALLNRLDNLIGKSVKPKEQPLERKEEQQVGRKEEE